MSNERKDWEREYLMDACQRIALLYPALLKAVVVEEREALERSIMDACYDIQNL